MTCVATIAPHQAFLDILATHIIDRAGGDPAKLAEMHILLPTRRACRELRTLLAHRVEAGALLLPRIEPLGDIDADELLFAVPVINDAIPPAIAPLRRRLLLAQLIRRKNPESSAYHAIRLADALARFLDEAQICNCDFSCLPSLIQEKELAQHWEEIVKFLDILTNFWPDMLKQEGCIDPVERRNLLFAAQIDAWNANPPQYPIIAAGSTGTLPATARLLACIADLPSGCVVLPGLDQDMDEEAWQAVDALHPQHGMKELINLIGMKRKNVAVWGRAEETPRAALLREAMRPASVTEEWRHLNAEKVSLAALNDFSAAEFANAQEEAQAIALMLRQAVEEPDRTAALVTSDRNLAERVATLLARWGIAANDSAGTSLAEQPVGAFLSALLGAARPSAGPVEKLALLKHPLTACGMATVECRARARAAELLLRREEAPPSIAWFDEVDAQIKDLADKWETEQPLAICIDAHRRVAEKLAATDHEDGAERLWADDAGEAAAEWLREFSEAARDFPAVDGEAYRSLFEELLRQANYRPTYGLHPRISILGPLEARLLHPDFVILGGLNEGTWPQDIPADPWMSRPMKRDFGMLPPEHRIGLAAHDFVQLASAPQVMLTRSLRAGGSPTVISRFLSQLETVLLALGYISPTNNALLSVEPWGTWAKTLDEPDAIAPCAPPEPRPALELRPKRLSVTEIGRWQGNPYAIYAKHVLRLRKLEELQTEPDQADRGNLIHEILEKFVVVTRDVWPQEPLPQLLEMGREAFEAYGDHAEVRAFWWPRFENLAAWFVTQEGSRRADGVKPLAVEASGSVKFGAFTLKGRADRVDRLADGGLSIIDYKTGTLPPKKAVTGGFEPQLPLLAMMAQQGAFADSADALVGEFAYWRLSGGRSASANKEVAFDDDAKDLIASATNGLQQLIKAYADPATPYRATPRLSRAPRYDDYAHLARSAEWGRSDDK